MKKYTSDNQLNKKINKIVKHKISEALNEDKICSSTKEEHDEMIDTMLNFFSNDKPQVGIFWFDYIHKSLFGIKKDDADKYIGDDRAESIGKLHCDYWNKQHHKAVNLNDTKSIFYKESNYTKIPKGRIFIKPDGSIFVAVGHWINGIIYDKKWFDTNELRDLLIDEFNLPNNFEFKIDEHWDLGHGWSGDKFFD